MQYCSIIDQHADSIEFAAGPTLTKSINDLRRFLVSLEPPRESPLARALHGLCLAGWGEPTANLLPYYPNGSPNDGREQTPHLTKLALKKTVQPARIMGISTQGYPISRLLQPQLIRQCG